VRRHPERSRFSGGSEGSRAVVSAHCYKPRSVSYRWLKEDKSALLQANPLFIPTVIGAAIFFWVGLTLERKVQSTSMRVCLLLVAMLLACPGLLFVLYYVHLFDSAAWFYNLRTVRYTELLGSGLGLLAGVIHVWWQPESIGEKAAVPTVLFVLVLIPFVKPLLDPLNLSQLKDRCEGDVCLQSTFSTCGPASAATLLRAFNGDASEKQLARESFTSRGGTEIWYLARALQRRGIGTRVVINTAGTDMTLPSPAIAGVVLPGNAGHFIALVRSDDSQVTFVDPMKGKGTLSAEELKRQYHFTGFFLLLSQPGT
jgi:Peptidase C39 family